MRVNSGTTNRTLAPLNVVESGLLKCHIKTCSTGAGRVFGLTNSFPSFSIPGLSTFTGLVRQLGEPGRSV